MSKNELYGQIALIVMGVGLFVFLMFATNSPDHAALKEACLQDGGTSVEQPAGTFIKCLK